MNKDMIDWFLLYCWCKSTTCNSKEDITAIGLNAESIALGIEQNNQYKFRIYTRDMRRVSTIQLNHVCDTIQMLPTKEWLISDSSRQYYVIDSELKEHRESNESYFNRNKTIIHCDNPSSSFVLRFGNGRIRVYMIYY